MLHIFASTHKDHMLSQIEWQYKHEQHNSQQRSQWMLVIKWTQQVWKYQMGHQKPLIEEAMRISTKYWVLIIVPRKNK